MVAFSEKSLIEAKTFNRHVILQEGRRVHCCHCFILHRRNLGGFARRTNNGLRGFFIKYHAYEVYEVATFYSMYNLKPVGKYLFEVCQHRIHVC